MIAANTEITALSSIAKLALSVINQINHRALAYVVINNNVHKDNEVFVNVKNWRRINEDYNLL